MPRRSLLILNALLVLSAIAPQPATACSCVGRDLVLNFQSRSWVFVGTVSVERTDPSAGTSARVSISLDEVFRAPEGAETPASFRVDKPDEGGNCRLDLEEGSRWIFFLDDLDSWPNVCDQSIPLSPDDDGDLPFWADALPDLLRSGTLQSGARLFPWRFIGEEGDHCQLQIHFHQPLEEPGWPDNGVLYFHVGRLEALGVGLRFHYSSELESPLDDQRAWLAVGKRSFRFDRRREGDERRWGRWELGESDPRLLFLHFRAARTDGFEIQVEGEEPNVFEDALRSEAFERFEACRDSLPAPSRDS